MEQKLFHELWQEYINARTQQEVLSILEANKDSARIVAGGTDLLLEMERGTRPGIKVLVDVTRIPGFNRIEMDAEGVIHLGPTVTHTDCMASELIRERAFPLAQACFSVGSPQIRNRGTLVGNLVTASPANDTISPLMALGAKLTLKSIHQERIVPLAEFYTGVRKTVLQPDEMVADIAFPAMQLEERGGFKKFALRAAQAISLINMAIILKLQGEQVTAAAITLGAVAPVIIHAQAAEAFLVGKTLTAETIQQAASLVCEAARPIDDIRCSAGYRRRMIEVNARRLFTEIMRGEEKAAYPARPILLKTKPADAPAQNMSMEPVVSAATVIETTINGKVYAITDGQNKNLLHFIRDEVGLMGTKEGCGEGECGACTVILDGMAVMGCLVPAPRASGANIQTVEGVAKGEELHPVQQAFIDYGAVQCGYCTPGFIMSGVKLLEEEPHPNREQIMQGLTGNLCRCTGYYKIIEAIEAASRRG